MNKKFVYQVGNNKKSYSPTLKGTVNLFIKLVIIKKLFTNVKMDRKFIKLVIIKKLFTNVKMDPKFVYQVGNNKKVIHQR
jgi:hypothetical protein